MARVALQRVLLLYLTLVGTVGRQEREPRRLQEGSHSGSASIHLRPETWFETEDPRFSARAPGFLPVTREHPDDDAVFGFAPRASDGRRGYDEAREEDEADAVWERHRQLVLNRSRPVRQRGAPLGARWDGEQGADGCPAGTGAYGFGQYPSVCGSVVRDDNTTAVLLLFNRAFNPIWRKHAQEAFRRVRGSLSPPYRQAMDKMGNANEQCSSHDLSRITFAGNANAASARFECRWADSSVTRPNATDERAVCSTVLRVWCAVPARWQRQLRAGNRVRVQLLRHEPATGDPVAYPPVQLCPQVPLGRKSALRRRQPRHRAKDSALRGLKRVPARGLRGQALPLPLPRAAHKLAACVLFNPVFQTERSFIDWMLWSHAVGVDHFFVYYMAKIGLPGTPEFGTLSVGPPYRAVNTSFLARAERSGLVTVRTWSMAPDWWFDPKHAIKWSTGRTPTVMRDWRLHEREGWPAYLQVPAYNDCVTRLDGEAEWAAVLDADELMHPLGRFRSVTAVLDARLAAAAAERATVTGLRLCQRPWWVARGGDPCDRRDGRHHRDVKAPGLEGFVHTTWNVYDNNGDHRARSAAGNGLRYPPLAPSRRTTRRGCHCSEWWKTVHHIPSLRGQLHGINMHNGDVNWVGAQPDHLNPDACSELGLAHARGFGRASRPPRDAGRFCRELNHATSHGLAAVAGCLDAARGGGTAQEPYDTGVLRRCFRERWHATDFGPEMRGGAAAAKQHGSGGRTRGREQEQEQKVVAKAALKRAQARAMLAAVRLKSKHADLWEEEDDPFGEKEDRTRHVDV
eukprot:g3336.t1